MINFYKQEAPTELKARYCLTPEEFPVYRKCKKEIQAPAEPPSNDRI
jgi:hypothetical protein